LSLDDKLRVPAAKPLGLSEFFNYNVGMMLTYRYRIKDAATGRHLDLQARAVNQIWNYCGEVHEAARRHNR